MSYVNIEPGYYQMLQPDSVYHPGGSGWSTAPVPGWGENPNLVGPPRLAVGALGGCGSCKGLGGVRAVSGFGDETAAEKPAEKTSALDVGKYLIAGVALLGGFWLLSSAMSEDIKYMERRDARRRRGQL